MFTVGLDVSVARSSLCILDDRGREHKRLEVRGRWPELLRQIDEKVPTPFAICFEASCGCGFLHDELAKRAARVAVAHPGSLALIYRSKRKNDRADAEKLAKLLYLNAVPAVHVPSMNVRQWRRMIEARQGLVRDRVVQKNRIRAVIRSIGQHCPVRLPWTKKGRAWLKTLEWGEGDQLTLTLALSELDHLTRQIAIVQKSLDRIGSAHPGVKLLMTIPGVGPRTAEAVVAYIDDVNRFSRVKQVPAYFGLVPCQDQSGPVNRLGHITRQGPSTVRKLLIEAAHMARRRSKTVRERFERISGGEKGNTKIAIVAVAHYLLRVMTAMLRSGEAWRHEQKKPWAFVPGGVEKPPTCTKHDAQQPSTHSQSVFLSGKKQRQRRAANPRTPTIGS